MPSLLRKLTLDLRPLRASRDFRLISIGQVVSALGTGAVMVALPYQIYVISRSAALVGLLGAFELLPMIVVSLIGGAIADRRDRRAVLAAAQLGIMVITLLLFALALAGRPPVALVLVLGGVLAACSALDGLARGSIIPGLLGAELLRPGLAFNYGLYQAAGIVGPGIGGLIIAAAGVKAVYLLDTLSCLGMLWAALAISAQPPHATEGHESVRRSIAEGLRFVTSNRALAGSFAIDINAMLFGMPRALFAVLSLSVYHAGPGGAGLLYAGISVGGTVAVLTSRWVQEVRALGRVVIVAVLIWGAAICGAGLVRSIAAAVVLLAVAGWADGISAVCRTTISQSVTPDRLRGRMGAFYTLVVAGGPRLGDMESGFVAGAAGALNSVLIGGVACIVGVGVTMLAFPQLAAYDAEVALELLRAENEQAHGARLVADG